MGLLDTLGLFGTAVLAAALDLLGVEFLLTGRPLLGVGFLAIAAALVVGARLKPGIEDALAPVGGAVVPDEDEETYKD